MSVNDCAVWFKWNMVLHCVNELVIIISIFGMCLCVFSCGGKVWCSSGSTAVVCPISNGYITVQANVARHRCQFVTEKPFCIVDWGATFTGGWWVYWTCSSCFSCNYHSSSRIALHSTRHNSSRHCMYTKTVLIYLQCHGLDIFVSMKVSGRIVTSSFGRIGSWAIDFMRWRLVIISVSKHCSSLQRYV